MAVNIKMPALSPTMTEGRLSKWLVKAGDNVRSGDVIAEIETDKATMEVEAVDDGKIGALLVPEGSEGVKVNTPIAVLIDSNETPHANIKSIGEKPYVEKEMPKVEKVEQSQIDLKPNSSFITVREALRNAMAEEMRFNKKVFVMGEEVAEYQGAYKVTQGLLEEFGDKRVYDTPITEHGFAGIGVGSTMTGNRPIIEFMTFNFALVGIDQIINNAAKIRQMSGGQFPCPIVFRGPTASAGQLAATHSQAFESWYANCPGLKVIVPSNPYDAKGLLKAAIRDDDPVIFMESEQMYGDKGEVPDGEYVLPIGVANTTRTGTDVTLVSFGKIFKEANAAAELLEKENISVELIDLRTIRPLDINTILESVKKTNRLVILEESWPFGNISTEITYQIQNQAFDYLDAPIIKINTADTPTPYSPVLLNEWLPNHIDVIKAVNKVLYK